ncbi:MAG: adenine phosphoribosyltransferase, partial [Gemmatimonadota bacterium]
MTKPPRPAAERRVAAAVVEPSSGRDEVAARLRRAIRDVPDFPSPGILFRDLTPAWADAALLKALVAALEAPVRGRGVTQVAGIEARGFLLAGALACRLEAGVVPLRKPGKLPRQRRRVDYALEYGTDAVEMHTDALTKGTRALVIDDVIATGGTARATCD